jgi:hypothetical protein
MRTKSTFLILTFLMMTCIGFSQDKKSSSKKKDTSMNIISGKVNISKYHNYDELDRMSKGELLTLYTERIKVIVNILPNIAFATKPGITMSDLGIPDTKENRKALENNVEASVNYFDSTIEFQKTILPYSDTRDLIAAILFYEETLKSLHTYNDFKAD